MLELLTVPSESEITLGVCYFLWKILSVFSRVIFFPLTSNHWAVIHNIYWIDWENNLLILELFIFSLAWKMSVSYSAFVKETDAFGWVRLGIWISLERGESGVERKQGSIIPPNVLKCDISSLQKECLMLLI